MLPVQPLREAALREVTRPVSLAGEQVLPVLPALQGLLPGGVLRRGSTVAVVGSTSLALVSDPGESWPSVVAALLDALDVVVVRPPGSVRGTHVRRLVARARERGAVLVPACSWEGADVCLRVTRSEWHGLGAGHGHLRSRRLEVASRGRGAATRPRQAGVWLPP